MTNSVKNVSNKINADLYNINDDVSLFFYIWIFLVGPIH